MERKRKKENRRSHMRNRLLCYLLSGALVLTNLAIMPAVSVSAAELTEHDDESQEELQPNVIVSNYDELVQAIDEVENGDVIGIDRIISICNDGDYLGAADKHITILKMADKAYFEVAQSAKLTVRNLTFDGNKNNYNKTNTNPMFCINSNVLFQNVVIENCYTQSYGGGLCINSGVVNINDCTFMNNYALGQGGHIMLFNTAIVNVRNTIFTKGKSGQDGGAICINGERATVNLINSKVYGNQSKGVGGGIKNNGKSFLNNTIIYGNTAECGADIANTMYAKFQIESIEKLIEIYKSANILPKTWITDFDYDSMMPPNLIDLSQDYALVKLDYEEIPEEEKSDNKTDDIQDTGDSSVNGESKGDGNEEDNNGSNPAADNKDNTDENNTGDSNSGQGNSEEGTAATDSEKENDSIENNEYQENQEENNENQSNQDSLGNDENKDGSSSDSDSKDTENGNVHTPDSSVGNGNQTNNSNTQKPNTDNNGSASNTTTSSEGNKQPDSSVNAGNQGGTSVGDTGNNSNESNQNQLNKPVSGAGNNVANNNPSGNTNSNINTGDNTSQSGGSVSQKPEDSKDTIPSDKQDATTIADNSQTATSDTNKDDSGNKNTVIKKKAIKKLTVTAKRGKKKITGKTIKKATIKVKIGRKTYKTKSNAKGKFTIKLKGKTKLKKGQKVKITVSKKGYKSKSKTIKVK